MAVITAWLMLQIYSNSLWLRNNLNYDFSTINPVLYGFLAGFGALFGDALKSFFKRRTSIKPGETWFPFDQIDYILGGIIFLLPLFHLDLSIYIITLVLYFSLHLLSTFLGYLLKLKAKPI